MTTEILLLTIAVVALAVSTTVLAGSVPFLWWRAFKLEAKIDTLDTALSEFMEVAGVKKE